MRMFNILCIFLLTFILQNCSYSSSPADSILGKSNRQSTDKQSPRRSPVGNIYNTVTKNTLTEHTTEEVNADIKKSNKEYDAYQHYQSSNPPKKAKRRPILNIHELNEIMDKEATIVTVEGPSERTLHVEADSNLKKVIDHNKAKKAKEKKYKTENSKQDKYTIKKKAKKKAKILVITKEILPQSNEIPASEKQKTSKPMPPIEINNITSAPPVIASAAATAIKANALKSPVNSALVTAPVLQSAKASTKPSEAVDTPKLPPITLSKLPPITSALVSVPIVKTATKPSKAADTTKLPPMNSVLMSAPIVKISTQSSKTADTTKLPPITPPKDLMNSSLLADPATLIVKTSTNSKEIVEVIELPSINSPEVLVISPPKKIIKPKIAPPVVALNPTTKIAAPINKNKTTSDTQTKSIAAPAPNLNLPKIDMNNMTQEDIEQVLKNKFISKKKRGAIDQAISDADIANSTTSPLSKKKQVPLPILPISMSNITESLTASKITNLNDLLIEYYFKFKYLLLNVFSFGY